MDSILSDESSEQPPPDDALSGGEQADDLAGDGATPEPAKTKAEPKDPAATVGDDDSDDGPMPADLSGFKRALAATRGDKRKARKSWQEAERKLAVLEGELNVLRRQPQRGEPESRPAAPSREDLENKYWEDPVAFTQSLVRRSVPDVDAVSVRNRADISEYYARQSHADYDEQLAWFRERVAKDPTLMQGIFESPAPAEALYSRVKTLREREEFEKDPEAWREAERSKIRAELDADPSGTTEQRQAPARTTIPKSLAGVRGNGAGVKSQWAGPRSLDDILA